MSQQPTSALTDRQVQERFWRAVTKAGPDDCWLWAKSLDGKGYGQFNVSGRIFRSHRVSFEIAKGRIPNGQCVCHRCDTPACVNPAHLFLGTKKANTRDMMSKGRDGHGRMPGSKNPFSKMTEESVREMRRLFATGEFTKRALARRFNITEANAGYILNGKAWKHV